jgi:steroid delta-isomerase-like uncharacterized protein
MSESNVARLQAAVHEWNVGNLEGYLALYDSNAILHGYAGVQPGQAGIRQFYQAFWQAFPDSQLLCEDVFASGDRVACRFVLQGKHLGKFQGIPPTGREITVPGITILEFANGGCIRRWSYTDSAGLLQQLGAVPSPNSPDRPTKQ